MVSISRVCDKQQGIFNNQSISIYGKLWKKVGNGCEFEEKRKDGKSNEICGKDKKGAGRSWNGINESIGGNKKADG